jgi:TonB family protein
VERDTKQDLLIAALLALVLHAALIPLRFSGVGTSLVPGFLQGRITVCLVARKPAAEVRVKEKGLPKAQKKRPYRPVAKAPQKKKAAPKLQSQSQPSKKNDSILPKPMAKQPETVSREAYQPESQAPEVLQETSPLPVDSPEAAGTFPSPSAGESDRESVDSENSAAGLASLQRRGQAGISQPFTEAVAPRYGFRPEPQYPSFAVRRGYEGTVLLRVCVLKNGRVTEVHVKETSGYKILDEAARRAVELWRFTPALLDVNPIDSWVLVPITFQLR